MLKTNIILIQGFKEDVDVKLKMLQPIRPISSFKYNQNGIHLFQPKKSNYNSFREKCKRKYFIDTIPELSYKYTETIKEKQ